MLEEIFRLFPKEMRGLLIRHLKGKERKLQEIRLRLGQPVEFVFHDTSLLIHDVLPNAEIFMHVINQVSAFSLYRLENELREGYVTIEGGHRVGLAGKVNTKNGCVKAIQYISFMNIRVAREFIGAAKEMLTYLPKDYCHTLIAGPPQTGKTTIIRDLVRMMATDGITQAKKVAVIDERSEIAAAKKGVPQHDLGYRTDVMDACPKAEGMMMMIRSMSPDILVVDEIGSQADVAALMEAIHAGVKVVCTIHGDSLAALKKRPSLDILFTHHVFERIIFLDHINGCGHIRKVYDQTETEVTRNVRVMDGEMDWRTTFR